MREFIIRGKEGPNAFTLCVNRIEKINSGEFIEGLFTRPAVRKNAYAIFVKQKRVGALTVPRTSLFASKAEIPYKLVNLDVMRLLIGNI